VPGTLFKLWKWKRKRYFNFKGDQTFSALPHIPTGICGINENHIKNLFRKLIYSRDADRKAHLKRRPMRAEFPSQAANRRGGAISPRSLAKLLFQSRRKSATRSSRNAPSSANPAQWRHHELIAVTSATATLLGDYNIIITRAGFVISNISTNKYQPIWFLQEGVIQ
jgi:hypothetical protein